MKDFFKKLITSRSGTSSKRFCGVIGWFVCMIVLLLATILGFTVPGMIETFMWCCVALLGIDSVSNMFKKDAYKEKV